MPVDQKRSKLLSVENIEWFETRVSCDPKIPDTLKTGMKLFLDFFLISICFYFSKDLEQNVSSCPDQYNSVNKYFITWF